MEEVVFDPARAQAAAAELRRVADELDELTRARVRLGEQALADWQGRRREGFADALTRGVRTSQALVADLRRAAATIEGDLAAARAEQRRRTQLAALVAGAP